MAVHIGIGMGEVSTLVPFGFNAFGIIGDILTINMLSFSPPRLNIPADLCGIHIRFRLSEGHARPDGPQVCKPGCGDQVLRPRLLPSPRLLVVEP